MAVKPIAWAGFLAPELSSPGPIHSPGEETVTLQRSRLTSVLVMTLRRNLQVGLKALLSQSSFIPLYAGGSIGICEPFIAVSLLDSLALAGQAQAMSSESVGGGNDQDPQKPPLPRRLSRIFTFTPSFWQTPGIPPFPPF